MVVKKTLVEVEIKALGIVLPRQRHLSDDVLFLNGALNVVLLLDGVLTANILGRGFFRGARFVVHILRSLGVSRSFVLVIKQALLTPILLRDQPMTKMHT